MQQKKHLSFIIYDHHGMGTTNLNVIDSTVRTTPPIPTHAVCIAAVVVAGARVSSSSLVGTNKGQGALCTMATPAARVTAAAAKRRNTQEEERIPTLAMVLTNPPYVGMVKKKLFAMTSLLLHTREKN